MNKLIPITDEQLIRFSKTFYKINDVSVCYVEDIYIAWEFFNTMKFNDCGFYFLDTAITNELIKFEDMENLKVLVSKILGTKK